MKSLRQNSKIRIAETRGAIDYLTVKIRGACLAMPGPFVLCRFECIGQISRFSPERLANKCRPVWSGAIGNTVYRQGARLEPLGTKAFSPDRQRPVRCGRIPALSRGLPENSALDSDGTFLPLPVHHCYLIALGDR